MALSTASQNKDQTQTHPDPQTNTHYKTTALEWTAAKTTARKQNALFVRGWEQNIRPEDHCLSSLGDDNR